jgi:hypothetical protein
VLISFTKIDLAENLGYDKEIVTNYLNNKGRGNDSKCENFVNPDHKTCITIDDFKIIKNTFKKSY